MLKFNKCLVASLLLACFIAACGGGGGSGSNDAGSSPTEQPTESNPIESSPVESKPLESSPPATLIISTPDLSNSNTVIAGQSFTITVKSSNGATGTVKFSNSKNTPASITYSPATCQLSSGNSCTTQVNVGLTTPATTKNTVYTTDISLENGNVENSNSTIEYKVTTPKLTVIKQPQNIIVGFATNVGFSIDSLSIPDGTGFLTLHLEDTSGFADLIRLGQHECRLVYQDHEIIENNCLSISITAPGPLTGETAINASAENFTGVNSNQINIEPGTAPSINITSSLQPGNPPSIIAGHSFKLIATSINGASAAISFGVTDPLIRLDKTSCTVNAGSYCEITVSVKLGTPPNLHDIIVDYKSGIASILLTKYRFKSETPLLEVANQPNIGALRIGSMMSAGFSLSADSIPEGSGTIDVDLKSSSEDTLIGEKSCQISYANKVIVDNKCENLEFFAQGTGIATITASAFAYTNISIRPIVVPNKMLYVLGPNQIIMFGKFNDGTLSPINNISLIPNTPVIPTSNNPGQIVISPDGRFLYVTDTVANIVTPYAISPDTGLPTIQQSLVIATGKLPKKMAISPNGNYAYVVNNGSNSVSQYIVNRTTGALKPNSKSTIATGKEPFGIAISSNGANAYITSVTDIDGRVSSYKISNTNGLMSSTGNYYTVDRQPSNIAISPAGDNLLVQCYGSVFLIRLKTSDTNKVYRVYMAADNVYFNPKDLPNGNELGYLVNNRKFVLYRISGSSGSFWDVMNEFIWGFNQSGPTNMAFDLTGEDAYIGHQSSKTISMYKIHVYSTGEAVLLGTVDSEVEPLGMVVSPN